MSSGPKSSGLKSGRFARPQNELSVTALTFPQPNSASPRLPDDSLSAAFRHAVGGKPGDARLPIPSLESGQEVAKRAGTDKPGASYAGVSAKNRIGPRSGHK